MRQIDNMTPAEIDTLKLKGMLGTPDKLKDCVLCGGRFSEFGNNPAPLRHYGQCCDHCNVTKVIPVRIASLRMEPVNPPDPEL